MNDVITEQCTSLHHAAGRGHDDVIEFLLSRGAEVNLRNDEGRTPLARAKEEGHTSAVRLLRKHGGVE